MKPHHLPELATLAAVSRHGSFARAAAELGVSRSAVSHAIRSLEDRLGVGLLNRTTRSVSPTAAGERLLARLLPALEDIANALEEANGGREHPTGRIRLNVPRLAAKFVLGPVLPRFIEAHPDGIVEVTVDDATVDIVANGDDAGIRFGERLSADMIAIAVGPPIEFCVVGSPAYLSTRPPLNTPEDLRDHTCIGHRMRGSGRLFDWEFEYQGRKLNISVNSQIIFNAPELILDAASSGAGLCYTTIAEATPYIGSGQLVRLLTKWTAVPSQLFIYYPGRRNVPALLKALIVWLGREWPRARHPSKFQVTL